MEKNYYTVSEIILALRCEYIKYMKTIKLLESYIEYDEKKYNNMKLTVHNKKLILVLSKKINLLNQIFNKFSNEDLIRLFELKKIDDTYCFSDGKKEYLANSYQKAIFIYNVNKLLNSEFIDNIKDSRMQQFELTDESDMSIGKNGINIIPKEAVYRTLDDWAKQFKIKYNARNDVISVTNEYLYENNFVIEELIRILNKKVEKNNLNEYTKNLLKDSNKKELVITGDFNEKQNNFKIIDTPKRLILVKQKNK